MSNFALGESCCFGERMTNFEARGRGVECSGGRLHDGGVDDEEARNPIFDLTPADGAIGSHAQLVRVCEQDFRNLAEQVAEAAWLLGRG